MAYIVHACNSYAEGIRQLESEAFEFIFVGQGSRFFEGRCVVERAIKINCDCPLSWWRAAWTHTAIWKRWN